jgi:SNF2 family DNA or RNA helicase
MPKLSELLSLPLLGFQNEGVLFAHSHHYCLLGDEMGLGKTPQGIAVSFLSGKTLVVCPASLKFNWEYEYNKFSTRKLNIHRFKKVKEILDFDPSVDIAIINYEMVERCEELFKWASIVIADEVHYLKTLRAQRTKAFHHMMKQYKPNRFIGLSGTTIKNRVPEFYSLLLLCSYNSRKTSGEDVRNEFRTYTSFCEYFSFPQEISVGGRSIFKYFGVRNIPRLKQLLRDKYLRREQKDVLELPELLRFPKVYALRSEPALAKAWEEFEVSKKLSESISAAKQASAMAKTEYTISLITEILEEDSDRQIVIFSEHILPVKKMCGSLNAKGVLTHYITGEVNISSREKIINEFTSKKTQVLIMTIATGGIGLNLVNSDIVVFNDMSWVPADNWQAEKRIHRYGQEKKCLIYQIVAGEIDEMITRNLNSKISTLKQVL